MYLNCHTYYSLRYGTISLDDLFEFAVGQGLKALALTDINNTSACLDFVRRAPDYGIHPVIGIDFRDGIEQRYVGIARNNRGFEILNRHLSHHLHSGEALGDPPNSHDCYFIYPLRSTPYRLLRPNEYIGVGPHDIQKWLLSPWRQQAEKAVILQSVSFRDQKDFNAHRLLRAIDNNTLLSKLPTSEIANTEETMVARQMLEHQFREYPHLLRNAWHILESSEVDFEFGKPKNKITYTGSKERDEVLLDHLAEEGMRYRFPDPSDEVKQRKEKELGLIKQMGFTSYFLINWDLVRYARFKNFFYVGRGSGANSMVAFLLRITDVDPIELDLYFERFINPYRTNPPDFDIDFSWTDREDITNYIFNTHGHEHTALLGAYNTFQAQAVTRELGKVFGLPSSEIEAIQRGRKLKQPGADHLARLVMEYSKRIHGFPSHLSIHSSGILISEKPIAAFSATFMPPKGFPTTQFSMLEAEDVGLYKYDILSQRGLGKIKDTLTIVRENHPEDPPIDIHDMPRFKKDPKVKELLRSGQAIGCFYVESPAMRMLLTKLQADDYIRLVAASSIIRPGVAKSGMMREYILRYRDIETREKAKTERPELWKILEETYGVMVYQEDVIKVAHYYAGLTLAESDVLRRGMSWKFKERNEFHKVKDKFFSNCREKGFDEKVTADVWKQIESFANFAFSKGHSASYAVESFQALYLKAYYPLEYIVATLNNGGGFYRAELYLHEARMNGGSIEGPCVNNSDDLACIKGKTIYIGLGSIKELEYKLVQAILAERKKGGLYKNVNDLIRRVEISLEQLVLLIRTGGFRFTGKTKQALLWDAHLLLGKGKSMPRRNDLFHVEPKEYKLPDLNSSAIEHAYDEIELLGYPLTSPFDLIDSKWLEDSRYGLPELLARDLPKYHKKVVAIAGYMITVKSTRTHDGKPMFFGTFIDMVGNWIDTVHFPPVARKHPYRGRGCYIIVGKVVEEFDYWSIEVEYMERMAMVNVEEDAGRHAHVG